MNRIGNTSKNWSKKRELNQCLFSEHLAQCSCKPSLDPNFFWKSSLYLKLKRQSESLSTQNEGKHLLSKTLLCVRTTWNLINNYLRVSMNHWSRLHLAVSHWFSDWLLKLKQPSSYIMKMHIKIQFYNPIVQRTTQFKMLGLIINHA